MRIRPAHMVVAVIAAYASFEISGSFFRSQTIGEAHRDIVLLIDERRSELAAATDLAQSYRVSASEVADTVEVFERLSGEAPSPLPLLAMAGPTLGSDIVVLEANWLVEENAGARDIRLVLTTHLDASDGGETSAVLVAGALSERMATTFQGFDVRVTGPAVITISLPDSRSVEAPKPTEPTT